MTADEAPFGLKAVACNGCGDECAYVDIDEMYRPLIICVACFETFRQMEGDDS